MKVCYFGSYDREYSRSRCIIKGLEKNGVSVIECNSRKSFVRRAPRLLVDALRADFDILLVGYPGQLDVFVAKIAAFIKRKPLVFDVFMSNYDANVLDNKAVEKGSVNAKIIWSIDKYSCKIADCVLLDTEEHIDFFREEFGIGKDKFRAIPIGADEDLFCPGKAVKNEKFTSLHYGRTSGLHGVEHIIGAARILESRKDVQFVLIGFEKELMPLFEKQSKPGNLLLKNVVPPNEIPGNIAAADVCLGIFGGTGKSERVIPNKVYEAIAMKKPIITGASPAMRREFEDKKDVVLCRMKSPEAIADAVLLLKENPELRKRIAKNGYLTFKKKFTAEKIGMKLRSCLESLLGSSH